MRCVKSLRGRQNTVQPVLSETLLSSELFVAFVTLIATTQAMLPFQVQSYVVLVSGYVFTQSAEHFTTVSLHCIQGYQI